MFTKHSKEPENKTHTIKKHKSIKARAGMDDANAEGETLEQ